MIEREFLTAYLRRGRRIRTAQLAPVPERLCIGRLRVNLPWSGQRFRLGRVNSQQRFERLVGGEDRIVVERVGDSLVFIDRVVETAGKAKVMTRQGLQRVGR